MILFLLNNPTLIYGQNDNDNNNQQVKDANYSPYGGNELYNNNNLNNIDQIRQSSYYDYLQNLRPQDYIQIFKGVVKGLQVSFLFIFNFFIIIIFNLFKIINIV